MAEYIDRELLLNDLETSIVVSGRNDVVPLELRGVHKVIDRIKSAPTADVVPVVRCKNCIYANDYGTICRYGVGRQVEPEHYCSYGERK